MIAKGSRCSQTFGSSARPRGAFVIGPPGNNGAGHGKLGSHAKRNGRKYGNATATARRRCWQRRRWPGQDRRVAMTLGASITKTATAVDGTCGPSLAPATARRQSPVSEDQATTLRAWRCLRKCACSRHRAFRLTMDWCTHHRQRGAANVAGKLETQTPIGQRGAEGLNANTVTMARSRATWTNDGSLCTDCCAQTRQTQLAARVRKRNSPRDRANLCGETSAHRRHSTDRGIAVSEP